MMEPVESAPAVEALSISAAASRLRVLTTLSNEVFFVTSTDGITMKNCFISPSVFKQLGFTVDQIFSVCVLALARSATSL
jgi:hypothetical protein